MNVLSLLAISLTMTACGISEKSAFPNKLVGKSSPGDKDGDNSDLNGAGNGDKKSDDPSADGGDGAAAPLDPASLVLDNRYRAYLNVASLLRLSNNNAPNTNFSIAAGTVKKKLEGGTADDGIGTQQTFGDGTQFADGKQTIKNTVGDREAAADATAPKPSESGVQTYRRVTGGTCPSTLICIDSLHFIPVNGDAITVCFRDFTSGKGVAIPYAVAPNYAAADYKDFEAAKAYGPFVAEKYPGADYDCSKVVQNAQNLLTRETISIQVAKITDVAVQKFATAADARADLALQMQVTRTVDDNRAPYLDETMRLQYRTKYFLNTNKKTLVKMVKSVRKSAAMPAILDVFLPMDGIQVDLHLELCADHLHNVNYCTP